MRTLRRTSSTTRKSPAALERLPEILSPRKLAILELVAKGLTNDEIAAILGISPGTVRIQLSSLLADLQVANRTEATAAYYAWKASPSCVSEVLARPAIAVLPFVALGSTRPEKAASAALRQDITTLFARWCWFPVIPCALSQQRPNTPLRELGRSLGARFLVNGSLRAVGSSFRITIRVDDAEEGRCLWTERHDFPREALFEVQDDICALIVAAAYDVLVKGIAARVPAARHPEGLDAWMLAHEGMVRHADRSSMSNGSTGSRPSS